jgi:hypothetical protein
LENAVASQRSLARSDTGQEAGASLATTMPPYAVNPFGE